MTPFLVVSACVDEQDWELDQAKKPTKLLLRLGRAGPLHARRGADRVRAGERASVEHDLPAHVAVIDGDVCSEDAPSGTDEPVRETHEERVRAQHTTIDSVERPRLDADQNLSRFQ